MTPDDFRRVVLGLTGVVEGEHMSHPDFRVNGRIFSSLFKEGATVKLSPDEQTRVMASTPGAFTPASGAWGRQGWTTIDLASADPEVVGDAVTTAWQLAQTLPPVKSRKPAARPTATAASRAGQREPASAGARAKTAPAKSSARKTAPADDRAAVDAYIARCAPQVRAILTRIRAVIRRAAPEATERISYQMPAFFQDGALIYYAPFTHHIGMYPPVTGGASLQKELSRYRGEKGNLRFPLDEPMPYALITRVVQARLADQLARQEAKRKKPAASKARQAGAATTGTTATRGAASRARTTAVSRAARTATAAAPRKKMRGRR